MIAETELSADERMQRRILDELHWSIDVKPNEIGVEVEDGIVTLTGLVGSFHEKWMAEQAALSVEDVRGVANELKIRPQTEDQLADILVTRRAVNALDWSPSVRHGSIKVGTADGSLVLEGTVDRPYEKLAAERAVGRVFGVRSVSNLITVHTQAQRHRLHR